VVEQVVSRPLTVRFAYLAMNEVMKVVKDYQLAILDQQFDNECALSVRVREGHWAEVWAKLGALGHLDGES
jgi:putative IMPACT (imprinted ancient) family translation regulator